MDDTAKENSPEWSDFKPPQPEEPVGVGNVVSPGLTIPETPTSDPPQEVAVAADPSAPPLSNPAIPSSLDPAPLPAEAPPKPPEPEFAPLPEPSPATENQVPVATSDLPVPSLPPANPSQPETPPIEPTESVTEAAPAPVAEAEVAKESTPVVENPVPPTVEAKPPEALPEPEVPQMPEPPKPSEPTIVDQTPSIHLTAKPNLLAATPVAGPNPVAAAVNPGHSRLGLIAVVIIIIGALGGGGYYAYSTNLISWPFGGSSPQTTPAVTENQSILAQAVGPATWENNYSTDLLPTEKGGLDFQVTDPTDATAPTTATSSAGLVDLSLLKSLTVKIAKVEVHLASRSVIATGVGNSATHSADQSADHWETLRIPDNFTVDLLALRSQGGGIADLGVTYLAAGHYTEIRVYLTGATAVTSAGDTVTVSIPGNSGIVKIAKPFDVTATGTKAILVDFDASKMVSQAGGTYQLQPVIGQVNFDGKPI